MSPTIDFEIIKDHIAMITLNRPEAANALSKDMLQALNLIIEEINDNELIYCTIITGVGNKAFCAGADLKERSQMPADEVITAVKYIGDTVKNIEAMRMPVIAALNGVAFGGGLELALACDLRIASKHAKMGLTETSLGIIPGAGGTQRLVRLIGLGQAKRLIYTATSIIADEALHIGLVEQVVTFDNLLHKTIEMAETIANNAPIAIGQAKAAIDQGYQTDLTTGLAIEHLCYERTIYTEDRLEGLQAFKEKRQPKYKGK